MVKILHSILVYVIQRMAVVEPAISFILSMIEGKRKSRYVIKADICYSTTAILARRTIKCISDEATKIVRWEVLVIRRGGLLKRPGHVGCQDPCCAPFSTFLTIPHLLVAQNHLGL
jgi:hypothetical protein